MLTCLPSQSDVNNHTAALLKTRFLTARVRLFRLQKSVSLHSTIKNIFNVWCIFLFYLPHGFLKA